MLYVDLRCKISDLVRGLYACRGGFTNKKQADSGSLPSLVRVILMEKNDKELNELPDSPALRARTQPLDFNNEKQLPLPSYLSTIFVLQLVQT